MTVSRLIFAIVVAGVILYLLFVPHGYQECVTYGEQIICN